MYVLYAILALIAAATLAYVISSIIQSKHYTGTVWVETEPSFVPSETDTKIPETEPSFVPSEDAQKIPETEPSFVPSEYAQKIPETDGLGDSK